LAIYRSGSAKRAA